MCIGHNVIPSVGIIDYAKDHKVDDKIEVVGLCCTAFDITRYYNRGKIVGPISWQLRFIRGGFADVVVLDEQCVRTDVSDEANKVQLQSSPHQRRTAWVSRTAQKIDADEIVADLVSGKVPGVLILDPEKVGEVAVRVANKSLQFARNSRIFRSLEEIKQ